MSAAAPAVALTVIAIIMLLIAGSAGACEIAFEQSSLAKAQDLIDAGRRSGPRIYQWMQHKYRCAAVTRTVKIIAQTFFTVAVTVALADLRLSWYWLVLSSLVIAGAGIIVCVAIIAVQLGRRQPEMTLVVFAPLLSLLFKIADWMAPLERLLTGLRPTASLTDAQARHEMADDLREMVDELGEPENLEIENEDREMLRHVFELGVTLVREVMTPRTDMVTIETSATLDEALTQFIRSGFSRIPVIGEDVDDIRGVLYLKDTIARLRARPELMSAPVHSLMREASFVPEMKLADDQLRDMQRDRVHLALVVDEWGGIAGLVTIEDLVEEIVGEVADEHDHAEIQPEEVEPGRWRVPTRLGIDELGELFDVELTDDEVDTAGGLLNKLLGKVAEPGDEAEIAGIHLRAMRSQGRKHQIYELMAWKTKDNNDGEVSQ